jgi:DnaJ-class molecular chaperone
MKECSKCGGSGSNIVEGDAFLVYRDGDCPKCNGTGQQKTTALQDALKYATDELVVQHRVIKDKQKDKLPEESDEKERVGIYK